MNLSERDESDLAGLASEMGDAESNARARRLMETNAGAREFYRQIMSICAALRAYADAELPRLSREETDTLAAAMLIRVKRRPSVGKYVLHHPWRWGAVAAAVAITIGTWFVFNSHTQPVVAEAIFAEHQLKMSPTRTLGPRHAQVRAGQLVETGREYAVLTLTNNSRLVAVAETSFVIQGTSQTIELQQGTLFLQAATAMQVQAADAVVHVEAPGSMVMVQTTRDGRVCTVYTGRATLTRRGKVTPLPAGRLATWDETARDVRVDSYGLGVPLPITNALDMASHDHESP